MLHPVFRATLVAAVLASVSAGAEDPRAAAFDQRLADYVKTRDTARQKVPGMPRTATPAEIERHSKAMVFEIKNARANAKQGSVFVPECQGLFLEILKANLGGATNQDSRAVARQGNPTVDRGPTETAPVIQVNGVYPASAPLSSVPTLLLLQLPKLPKDIEYRFSGQTLLLLDTEANLIIDYIKGAAPVL